MASEEKLEEVTESHVLTEKYASKDFIDLPKLSKFLIAGQAFPQNYDTKFDEKFCEIKLYSTTVPRDHALLYTLPQDTKTRIRSRVHSFWVTGKDCCWEIRR